MRKTKLLLPALVLVTIFAAGYVFAAKPDPVQVEVGPSNGHANPVIPEHAYQVTPNIFYLGNAIDPETGRMASGYAIITHKNDLAQPGCNNNGICEPGEHPKKCGDCENTNDEKSNSCYGFLAKGAKWKTIEPYMIDPTNSEGLSDSTVRSIVDTDITKWENASATNIIGSEIFGVVDGADGTSPDGKNEILFGEINQGGAIAVTIVWGYFGGPPKSRELIEWDQVYDQVDFDWSADCESENCTTKMDFENIAIHELGHTMGLDDLYEGTCSEQTMYGYASNGETKKRSLEAGDIKGIQLLYK